MTIDIFIKTCKKDEKFLYYSIKGIQKYLSGYRDIVIVTDADHDLNIIGCKIINLPPADYSIFNSAAQNNKFRLPNFGGYIEQQVIKMSWFNYTDADMVFVLDSDRIAKEYCNIQDIWVNNNKPIWIKELYSDIDPSVLIWKVPTDKLFDCDINYHYMNALPMLLDRTTTIKFNEFFQNKFGISLKDYFFNPFNDMPSEFNFYGAFIDNCFSDNYLMIGKSEYLGWNKFLDCWSWGGMNSELEIKLQEITTN